MYNIIINLLNIIKNIIKCFVNSYHFFPLCILLIIIYMILNHIFAIIENEFISNSNGIESIIITIPNTYIFRNIIIITLILTSNFIYNIIFKKI